VIPLAAGDEFQSHRERSDFKKTLAKYHLQPGYILTLSALEPRKNLPFLISAYEQMRNDHLTELPLVIAGPPWFKSETVTQRINESPWKKDIISTGFIEQDDLPYIYSGADLFVLPSLYEGFGLPLLEALGCGVPCVVSNRTSLPEIGGDAVLYFDPTNQDELIHAMNTLLHNDDLRHDLVTRGLERAKQFSWERTARLTHEVYQKVLDL
jgi:glycosyltransferase involved in cell wall biosynthesis